MNPSPEEALFQWALAKPAEKQFAETETLLRQSYQGMKEREGKIPEGNKPNLASAFRRLAPLYADWGKPERAAEWKQKLAGSAKAAKPYSASARTQLDCFLARIYPECRPIHE